MISILTNFVIVGDIWSENGIALLAVLLHYIDDTFKLCCRLVVCAPFSDVPHNGKNIRDYTYRGLYNVGIGDSIEDVPRNIHVGTPDEGSNMMSAWKEIEGAGCVCHRQQNCLKVALSIDSVTSLIKKVKGACAHFHRTQKVN